MPIYDRSFPYKIYEATNAASTGSVIFLGKSSKSDINEGKYYPNLTGSNCFTTFLFASIEQGKNVKVSPATEQDPYIFLDSKWFDFRPCGGDNNPSNWPVNSLLSTVNYDIEKNDTIVTFKSIVSYDGTMIVDVDDCDIKLSCFKYYCGSLGDGIPFYTDTLGNNGISKNTIFTFKSLLAGGGIRLCDDGKTITIHFDPANYEKGPPPNCIATKYSICDFRYPKECSSMIRRAEILLENEPFPQRIY